MLGYLNTGVSSFDDWKQLLHPDDCEPVTTRLKNHMQGLTPHFEAEYRVRNASGRYRWLSSRGTAFRHASGKPYRVVVPHLALFKIFSVRAAAELERLLLKQRLEEG